MKQSIKKKLKLSGITVIMLILSIAFAGQVCIFILKQTSHKIVVEYNELEAVQEYKLSLHKVLTSLNTFLIVGNTLELANYNLLIKVATKRLEDCKSTVTKKHDVDLFIGFETDLLAIKQLGDHMLFHDIVKNRSELNEIKNQITRIINEGIKSMESIQDETNIEIEEYVLTNDKAIKHSMATIISLGIVIIIIVMIGGYNLIQSITLPIKNLIKFTKLIGEGNLNANIQIDANSEFESLAENFNSMILALRNTTVSRNHYDNILKSMIDPIIVTDSFGKINTLNKAATFLLGYDQNELKGENIEKIFYNPNKENSNQISIEALNKNEYLIREEEFLSKSGLTIPVKISGARIRNTKNENDGYVIVAHDLTLQKNSEQMIEDARRERLIAINDAEEKERLRIATDLHDGLGQILTAISYSLQNSFSEELLQNDGVQSNFENIQKQLDGAIKETKNIAHNLIPMVLNDFGLIIAIENLVSDVQTRSGIEFNFNAFDFNDRIDKKLEKTIYRICQEAINNIIKHSKAKKVDIQILRHDHMVVLVILDDGHGFDYDQYQTNNKTKGIGLMSIRERVRAFKGEFLLNSNDEGTEIIIELPCRKAVYEDN